MNAGYTGRMEEKETSVREYVEVLRRRRLILLLTLILVPLGTYLFSMTQPDRFAASADVLLRSQDLASSLSDITNLGGDDPERLMTTRAKLARVPDVATRTLDAADITDRSARDFLDQSDVSTEEDSDIIELIVEDAVPDDSIRLATAYAEEFSAFLQELDTRELREARTEVQAQLEALGPPGDNPSPTYQTLVEDLSQLRALETLQTGNAEVVRVPTEAYQVQPRPLRNAVLGIGLGLVLAIALAFLAEALDTRVRSDDEIANTLGLPLLGRLSRPSRRLQSKNQLAMLAEPTSPDAEAFRLLRTNLQFVNAEAMARRILVTSAVGSEGKSTTAANLAVALARGGARVVLVDFDLRRPAVERFFGLRGKAGVTDVVIGRADLDDVLVRVPLGDRTGAAEEPVIRPMSGGKREQSNGRSDLSAGSLQVLARGFPPPNPGEFASRPALELVLDRLSANADVVVVDGPPMLQLGDALLFSSYVDGLLVVTRLDVIRRKTLRELRRLLDSTPARVLGVVVTGAPRSDSYTYYGDYRASPRVSSEAVVRS
jgi:Mrp family chromosome partitioning ATPase